MKLRDLNAELTTTDYGGGVRVQMLMFECPNPRCACDHWQGIPHSDEPFHEIDDPSDPTRKIKLWQRVSGSTIDDITMTPSFVVQSCDGLHGWIRNGEWVPC